MAGNKTLGLYAEQKRFGTLHSLALKGKDRLPIVLHADDRPAVLHRLVIERLRERPDFRVGQPFSGTVGVFAFGIVVQDEHRESGTAAGLSVFEHLLVAAGIAKSRVRPAADHQVNAFGFAGIVIVEQHFRFLGQERFAVLVVTILCLARGADDLLGGNAIGRLGILAHKVLPAAGHDVGLVTIGSEILQHLLHG